ncbi:hypothetical protein SFRURICE_010969 [Spodoptera frugiperda]|nr:hypothetical protein SFRURICE_010969 [Spodoptera frugiperda]
MIFPTTHTCSNTLSYPCDVHSWAEYAFYFHTIELLWGNCWIPWFPGVLLAWGSNDMARKKEKKRKKEKMFILQAQCPESNAG